MSADPGVRVVGLDLASVSTGVCHPDGVTERIVVPSEKGGWLFRAQEMRDRISPIVEGADLVVAEDIVIYGRTQPGAIIPLCYVHCQVEARLTAMKLRYRRYSPDQVKVFGTGKRCTKDQLMIAAVRNGWQDHPDSTNDESDAWWLWQLGCALLGSWQVEPTQFRRAIVATIHRSNNRP